MAGKPESMGPSSLPIKTELNALAPSLAKTIDTPHLGPLAANNTWGAPPIAGDRIAFEGWVTGSTNAFGFASDGWRMIFVRPGHSVSSGPEQGRSDHRHPHLHHGGDDSRPDGPGLRGWAEVSLCLFISCSDVESDRLQLADLAQRVRSGRLKPVIGAVRPLAEVPSAFAPDRRVPGKTIIRVTQEG